MKIFLAGEWVDKSKKIEVRNPYDNSVIDTVPKDLAGSGADADVTRRVTTARWSLVPRFQKELASKYPTFNARSETVHEKSTFTGRLCGPGRSCPPTATTSGIPSETGRRAP